MIEPLRISFDVACPRQEAYELWTSRTATWWPSSHTMSGDASSTVIFQARTGGRIFERTADGRELDFGEVTLAEPPQRIAYVWHMRTTREDATDVEIRFDDNGDGTTSVHIVHSGWERLGAGGAGWRERNHAGWSGLLPTFAAACAGKE